MAQKSFEDWSWEELVDHCAGHVLKQLINGQFRTAIFHSLDLACRWQCAQQEKEKKKNKKKKRG